MKRTLITLVLLAVLSGGLYLSITHAITSTTYMAAPVAATTSEDTFEAYVEHQTDIRLKQPEFIAKMQKEARMDVMSAINMRTNSELDAYLVELNKEAKGLK